MFVLFVQVFDDDVEHEPVQLGFRQRICPFQFDRILRGQHEERSLHRIGHALDRHLQFLHRFQQRRLRFGRSAVDFIGKQDVGEDRSFDENELASSRGQRPPE